MKSSLESYQKSPYRSIKHSTYFDVYDALFSPWVGKNITFVEVGVLGGGSLFMWRDFFGPQARIIGIDLNPAAKKWEEHGFEIFIGNQADPNFWRDTCSAIGPIDLFLDDGGHTYLQQAVTFQEVIGSITDGGLLVIEDTHTSYMRGFGPKSYSFVKFAKRIVDSNNRRFGGLMARNLDFRTWAVQFFESFVVFHVDRPKSSLTSIPTDNGAIDDKAVDFRHESSEYLRRFDRLVHQVKFASFAPVKLILGGVRARLFDLLWDRPKLAKLFRTTKKF